MSCYLLTYMMRCVTWYHLYNLKNVKNTHGGVLILVEFQAEACNYTKTITPPWAFFSFFKLCKWYKIAQCTLDMEFLSNCLASNFIMPVLVNIFYTVHYTRLHHFKKCCFIFTNPFNFHSIILIILGNVPSRHLHVQN